VRKITLLVKRRLRQAETVDNINDRLRGILDTLLLTTLGRGVTTNIKRFTANLDLCAVGFVCYTINFLEVVRVGNDFVLGDEILRDGSVKK